MTSVRRFRRKWRRNRNIAVIAAVVAFVLFGSHPWIPTTLFALFVAGRVAWWALRRRPRLVDVPSRPGGPARRCAVYRFYGPPGAVYNAWTRRFYAGPGPGRQLLYVGKAVDPWRRRNQHAEDKPWWPFVDETATVIEWFESEYEAFDAEESAIKAEMPLFNEVHNLANPIRVDW